ncbi:MAG: hypothetical protein HQ521_10805, partial [Bacteroidetes bacterium]|nr:hypothetical protein [Bacteroidota bacterium]
MQKAIYLLFIIICSNSALYSQSISLQLFGNELNGFGINILYNGKTVSCNEENSDFNLIVENADRSHTDSVYNWKATLAEEIVSGYKLSGQYYLQNLMCYVTIEVNYYIVNDYVIKKEISLEQNNIPLLFYQIENKLSPCNNDVSYWSFDHLEHQGGSIREIYPAAGFFFEDSIAVGLLTDAGYRNQWTRNIRKRPTDQGINNIGFKAVQTIADVNLYQIANNQERAENNQYVSLTFGELSDYNNASSWKLDNNYLSQTNSVNGGIIKAVKGNSFLVSPQSKPSEQNSGIKIPFSTHDGFYTIKFKYKAAKHINLRLLKSSKGIEEVVGFHYKSGLPASSDEWHSFEESALLQGIVGGKAQLLIESKSEIEINDFEILEITPKRNPYHRMPIGEKQTKTIVMFVQKAKDIRDIRLASQTRLAEGLGFKGSEVEKVLYADLMMLTWISGAEDFSPHNVPSINYAPDMYNRDAFWSIVSVYDKELNEAVWKKWGGTQDKRGAIGTIITPYMGSVEKKGNEATCEWIWWALINSRRYNSTIDTVRLGKALEFCYNEFDPDHDGIVSSHFSLSQNDVVFYENKKSNLAVNQGVYAITLMAAKELGFDIEQDYIDKSVQEYRNFYDKEKGYIVSDRDFPYVISFTDLMPEFVSWWLWDAPLLDS